MKSERERDVEYIFDIIHMYIRVASLTPNFTNMAQTTYLHVLIDIFMSAELKNATYLLT